MITQGHHPTPSPTPGAHHPNHPHGGKVPAKPTPAKPKAPAKPTAHKPAPAKPKTPTKPTAPKPTTSKKTAARWEMDLEGEYVELIGMKQDGHIH